MSIDGMRSGLSRVLECRYDETSKGLFRLESSYRDGANGPPHRTLLSYDGKEQWKLMTETGDEGTEFSQVHVGADLIREYDGLAKVRGLIDTALTGPHAPSLTAQVIEGPGAVAMGMETIDGDPCLVVRREDVVNNASTRSTVWLDPGRQFVLRRAQVDVLYPVNQHWFAFNLWTIQKLGRAKIRGKDGKEEDYWYPIEATLQLHNYRDEETFGEKLSITRLDFNIPMNDASFTPKIPQGSNVLDARTGFASVHGNGPSPAMKKLVADRTRQSREKLREVADRGDPGAQNPPPSWIDYGSWVIFTCGAIALVTALVLRRRG